MTGWQILHLRVKYKRLQNLDGKSAMFSVKLDTYFLLPHVLVVNHCSFPHDYISRRRQQIPDNEMGVSMDAANHTLGVVSW